MIFRNISTEKKYYYRLNSNEKAIFYMFNRSGKITFELSGTNAEAHIFSFFIGKNNDKGTLNITQKHTAPKTTSGAIVKSILFDKSEYNFSGLIAINKQAKQSDASQENRALLLSPLASASAKPALEILTDDVKCQHSATASNLNQESIFFARSRGLSLEQAEQLLIFGFIQSSLNMMKEYMLPQDNEGIVNLESRIMNEIKLRNS